MSARMVRSCGDTSLTSKNALKYADAGEVAASIAQRPPPGRPICVLKPCLVHAERAFAIAFARSFNDCIRT